MVSNPAALLPGRSPRAGGAMAVFAALPVALLAAPRRLLRRRRAGDAGPRPFGLYRHESWFRRHRRLCFVALIAFAFLYGFAFAILARVFLVQLMIPVAVLMALALWAMHDTEVIPDRWLKRFLFVFLFGLLCWPDYLAIDIPGLPWITVGRLTAIPLALTLALCASFSAGFRREVAETLRGEIWVWRCFYLSTIIMAATIAMSPHLLGSLNRFINAQLYWTVPFLASCWWFGRRGAGTAFVRALWISTLIVCAIALYEVRYEALPWVGRIPPFLQIDDEFLQRLLAGARRDGSTMYRVQSKFGVSLVLGEYLGLVTPFIIHRVLTSARPAVWVGGAATLLLIGFIALRTDSRLAMIGLLLSFVLYGFYWSIGYRRRNPDSVLPPLLLMAYPFGVAALFVLSLVWTRLTRMTWGGGQYQSSNDARSQQWAMGIDKIVRNPIGHGMGTSGETLGYFTPGGLLTVDSYYLTLLLELGVAGFALFMATFAIAAVRAAFFSIRTRDAEMTLLAPAAIALAMFILSKSVLSQQEIHPLAYIILGLVLALCRRCRAEVGEPAAAAAARPA